MDFYLKLFTTMCLLVICILVHVERDPLACHFTNEKLESVCYIHPNIFVDKVNVS